MLLGHRQDCPLPTFMAKENSEVNKSAGKVIGREMEDRDSISDKSIGIIFLITSRTALWHMKSSIQREPGYKLTVP
jgi:hypothetical protein